MFYLMANGVDWVGVLLEYFFLSTQESHELPAFSSLNSIWAISVTHMLIFLLAVIFHTTTNKPPPSFGVLGTKTFHHSTIVILGSFVLGSYLLDVLRGSISPIVAGCLSERIFFLFFLLKILELFIDPLLASLAQDSSEFEFFPFFERIFMFLEYWLLSKYYAYGDLSVIVVFDILEQVLKHLFLLFRVFHKSFSSGKSCRLLIQLGCMGFLIFHLLVNDEVFVTPLFLSLLLFQKCSAVYHLGKENRNATTGKS